MSVQHLLQIWLRISLFEGLLQASDVDFSVGEHNLCIFFVYFLCVFLSKILEDIWHAKASVQTENFQMLRTQT